MNWCDLLDKWQSSGKITPRDILKINIFERLQLANFWGIKTNMFKVTKDLIKSATNRERNCIRLTNAMKKLKSSNCNQL